MKTVASLAISYPPSKDADQTAGKPVSESSLGAHIRRYVSDVVVHKIYSGHLNVFIIWSCIVIKAEVSRE